MSKVIKVRGRDDYDKFKYSYPKAVIFYGSENCVSCASLKGLYDRIANRYGDKVALGYVDVDKSQLDFSNIPVFVSFKDGKQFNSIRGATKDTLRKFIKEIILS